jgi:L-asparaginase II
MNNPIIAEVTRGPIVESRHHGAYVVCDAKGKVLISAGDVHAPVYPRSAIKAFQCLPMIESGAADAFGFTDEEIALCCSSHSGEADHVRVAKSILAKCMVDETCYECGAHYPSSKEATYELVRHGEKANQIHNNCSGKHAGMLALAKQLGIDSKDYVKLDHPVQKAIAKTIEKLCEVDMSKAPVGVDGCSVPTWAIPLHNMALGFAKLCDETYAPYERIIRAARNHPFMIAGSGRFDTRVMQAVPRLFMKFGAEGVFCGCIPHAGLGFAVKCDDGAARAVEVAMISVALKLDVWTSEERESLSGFHQETMKNWRKIEVGEVRGMP